VTVYIKHNLWAMATSVDYLPAIPSAGKPAVRFSQACFCSFQRGMLARSLKMFAKPFLNASPCSKMITKNLLFSRVCCALEA